MIRTTAFALAALLAAAFTHTARADACSSYVKILTGVPAPCDGVGMATEELSRFIKIENEAEASRLKIQALEDQAMRDAATCEQEVDNQRQGRIACERDKSWRPEKPGLLKSPEFWGVTGAVLGVALTVIVYAVK